MYNPIRLAHCRVASILIDLTLILINLPTSDTTTTPPNAKCQQQHPQGAVPDRLPHLYPPTNHPLSPSTTPATPN